MSEWYSESIFDRDKTQVSFTRKYEEGGTLRRSAATEGRGNFNLELPRPSLEAQGCATQLNLHKP
jgi:hypothetical protein